MRVSATAVVPAPPEAVWGWVGDLRRWPDFVAGLIRWDPDGRRRTGLGARRRALVRVGSADVGGLIEVVELHPPADLAWSSVTGAEHRGRWRLRPQGDGATRVELRLTYHVAGWSPAAWLVGRIAARPLRAGLERTLRDLTDRLEAGDRPHGAVSRPAAIGA